MKNHYKGSKAALILMPLHCPPTHSPSTRSPFTASHCPRPHPPTFLYASWNSLLLHQIEKLHCKPQKSHSPFLVHIPPEEAVARTKSLVQLQHLPSVAASLVFQLPYSSPGKAHEAHCKRHISYISSTAEAVTNWLHVSRFQNEEAVRIHSSDYL